jgi:hypothetical protein
MTVATLRRSWVWCAEVIDVDVFMPCLLVKEGIENQKWN